MDKVFINTTAEQIIREICETLGSHVTLEVVPEQKQVGDELQDVNTGECEECGGPCRWEYPDFYYAVYDKE